MKQIISELRRRNVFRMAILYAVVAWMILSISDIVFGILGTPDGALRIVFAVLLVGFPIALFLSWYYEITPEGLKREIDVLPDESVSSQTGHKMNFLIAIGVLILLAGMAIQYFVFSESGGLRAIDQRSIAVLPFVDMSPEGDQEYFGDGIAEELLNLLAKIPELQVAARTSSFSLKGKDLDIATIGERLKVANVLEGSIRKAGDQVRITAQLISAKNGYHLFSETYDRAMVDIFAVQDEISARVVDQLKITLLDEEAPAARRTDPEVFNLYLQGRQYGRLRTAEGFEKALEALEQAVAIDPDYAPAWAEMGLVQLTYAQLNNKDEDYERARVTLEKALSIDPDLPEAWANLSGLALAKWNYTLADEYLQEAMSLDGESALVFRRAAILALNRGDLDRAVTLNKSALRLDPLSLALHINMGLLYRLNHQLRESLEYLDKAIALSPNFSQSNYHRGRVIQALGDPETALTLFEKESMEGRQLMGQAIAYWDLDRKADSDAAIAEMLTDKYLNDGWGPFFAQALAYRGDVDPAFELLEQAYETRETILMQLIYDPDFGNLHSDPRWADYVQKIKALAK
jgi:adenylate cyclase